MSAIHIVNFYKFVKIQDLETVQAQLKAFCQSQALKGSILLAAEGINAMLAGSQAAVAHFMAHLQDYPEFKDIEGKFSLAESLPFHRLKVVLKQEIVALGLEEIDPTQKVGTYVPPQEWNALISQPDVLLIDTRNDYEVAIGTFQGALNPNTKTFKEFPEKTRQSLDPKQHKKVAMFCTGGIRCEKASAFLLEEGFETVYHLEGGILKYLETIPESESLWQGECFVFDNRITVDHALAPGSYSLCFGCKTPLSDEDKASPLFESEVQCPHCASTMTEEKRQRCLERKKQMALAQNRQVEHLGAVY